MGFMFNTFQALIVARGGGSSVGTGERDIGEVVHTRGAACGRTTTWPHPHIRVCVLAALRVVIIVEITLK